jgi:hypothetical protein
VIKNNVYNYPRKSPPLWGQELSGIFEQRMRVGETVNCSVHFNASNDFTGIDLGKAGDGSLSKVT